MKRLRKLVNIQQSEGFLKMYRFDSMHVRKCSSKGNGGLSRDGGRAT